MGVQPASSFFIILTSKACIKSCVYLMLLVYVIRRRLPYSCSYYLNSVFTRHQTFDLAPYSIHYHKISLKYRIHVLNNRVMISCFWMKLPCGRLWKICPEDRNRDYICCMKLFIRQNIISCAQTKAWNRAIKLLFNTLAITTFI